ncbi:aquaporin-like protein [Cryphonectria parasitica EP155]|uniref:Aquaporin-like protein n=1 Tax=Cryphonectria parasitica (strain ATCC 38755 / EP155) TaxID=660469 RepID=A0A9P4YEF3_CRYP1|nr:aquaporin-like protein [Cryphonectria parasitica EP155]KAF3771284.1 aquaporin-like protein [Cryphonectria parasitica EP155]
MAPNTFLKHVRLHAVEISGEFAGTFLFLLMALSAAQVANSDTSHVGDGVHPGDINLTQLLYISLAFGFSLAVNVSIFARVSGGLFNPAVTLGMCLVGKVAWIKGIFLAAGQVLGAVVASLLVKIMFPGTYVIQTKLGHGASPLQGLLIEAFLTMQLMLAIYFMAVEKHEGNALAALVIGFALFVAELPGIYYTGGSLNPARTFGPDLVMLDFGSTHWIYWLGPLLGATLAAGFYRFIKLLQLESAEAYEDAEREPLLP